MLILTIALRYLFALRKASTIQILSVLSFFGILLGSMAMFLVLSAFNGFESLLKELYHFQDPDLKITSTQGKTFQMDSLNINRLKSLIGVSQVFEILSDKAAIRYGEGQMVLEIVGIPDSYLKASRMDTLLHQGNLWVNKDSESYAMVSIGVKEALNISLKSNFDYLQVLYPRSKKLLQPGLSKILSTLNIQPAGVLRMDENKVFLPIDEVRRLMEKPMAVSQIQIFVKPRVKIEHIKAEIVKVLGEEYFVQDEYEQHADLFKVMQIERLFVSMALGFIILISCFNLFVSISMLVLNKRKDIQILAAMGMPSRQIRRAIQLTGALVSCFGLAGGLLLGWVICLLQLHFGFVPLGMSTTTVLAYPIDIQWDDFFVVGAWVAIASVLALIYPGAMTRKFADRFHHY